MYDILDNIYFIVLLFPSFLGLILLLHCPNLPLKKEILPFFYIFINSVEKFCSYLGNLGKQNLWVYNFSSVIEICFYIWFISSSLANKKLRFFFKMSIIFFVGISAANILFFQGLYQTNTITYAIGCLGLIGCCICYFYDLLSYPTSEKLTKKLEFWITTGVLFSFTCSFPSYCLINFYNDKLSQEIWPIIGATMDIINLVFYPLICIGLITSINFKQLVPNKTIQA